MGTLTKSQVETFRRDGYTLYEDQLFGPEDFNRLRTIFDEHLEARGDKQSDELDTPHFTDERLLEFLLADEVVDLIEPLIGPDIALWSSHFISKEPYSGRATPWHEDSAYWDGRLSAYDQVVTVWLALTPSTRENGCMRVIPGTQEFGSAQYRPVDTDLHTFRAEIEDVDESQAVYFELQPGQCSLHDGRIVHGATANNSPTRRTGYTMRYFPSSVYVIPEANPGWKLWLARGRDLAGNTYENT